MDGMIYVECTIVNMNTNLIKAQYSKSFNDHGQFNSWYKMAKLDSDFVMNIMKYNPNDNPGLKSCYDAKLLSTSRRNIT